MPNLYFFSKFWCASVNIFYMWWSLKKINWLSYLFIICCHYEQSFSPLISRAIYCKDFLQIQCLGTFQKCNSLGKHKSFSAKYSLNKISSTLSNLWKRDQSFLLLVKKCFLVYFPDPIHPHMIYDRHWSNFL